MEVAVVVPVYRDYLTSQEKICFSRASTILQNYPIIIIAPKGISDFVDASFSTYRHIYLEDYNFVDRKSYSKMCLEKWFYEIFLKYEYILICQLDAYVLGDRLMHYCLLGYDYYGAPVSRIVFNEMQNIPSDEGFYVGNGGFSLRKTNKCYEMSKRKETVYNKTGLKDFFERAEDAYWAYCGFLYSDEFYLPNIKTSVNFCFNGDPDMSYLRRYLIDKPFGMHGIYHDEYSGVFFKYIAEKNFFEKKPMPEYYDIYHNISICRYVYENMAIMMDESGIEELWRGVFDEKLYAVWGVEL